MTAYELRIGAVVPTTMAEGPGRRFAVWAQGCSIGCSGCFNPHLWGTRGGETVDPLVLARDALRADVEGVTLLGGEPFEQAEAFAVFAEAVRQQGLSVMTFSGLYREALDGPGAPAGAAKLLAATDLLLDGPYIADQVDLVRPWVGSTNQRFHFLTDRYRALAMELSHAHDQVEIRISPEGRVAINGWATVSQLDKLLAGLTPAVGRGAIR